MFWGPSPATLTQLGRTPATVTTYGSYPLNCGATYYYGVEAVDTSGNTSSMSTVISISTPNPPSPPNGLAATATSVAQVHLTWSAAASGGLPVNFYHVYRGTSPSGSQPDRHRSADLLYGHFPERFHHILLRHRTAEARGEICQAMSAVVSVTMPALPAPPSNLVIAAASSSKLNLTWSAGVSGGLPINYYHVFRGTTPANLTQLVISPQLSYWDVTVTAGATYYYGVESADSAGDLSPMSTLIEVTILRRRRSSRPRLRGRQTDGNTSSEALLRVRDPISDPRSAI